MKEYKTKSKVVYSSTDRTSDKYGVKDVVPSELETGVLFPSVDNWAESFGRSGSNH